MIFLFVGSSNPTAFSESDSICLLLLGSTLPFDDGGIVDGDCSSAEIGVLSINPSKLDESDRWLYFAKD